MTDIIWEEPPEPQGRTYGSRQAFVAELRKRPGQWARYPYPVHRQQLYTNRKDFPDVEWLMRPHVDDGVFGDNKVHLYGRYRSR
jgi:hypothetical protein